MKKETQLIKEHHISQISALQLLQNLGYTYLTPHEALQLRGGRARDVILDGILEDQIRKMNKVWYKGNEYPFTEGNIISAVQALKDVIYDGLVRTNEKVYDLLCIGKSLQQSIQGDIKSFSFHYVDWDHPQNNVYHVTDEFGIERIGNKSKCSPDIVLFVNGIPFCVIECRDMDIGIHRKPIEQVISRHISNQKDDNIPYLFLYSQILIALSMNEARYATVGTPMEFWAIWKEQNDVEDKIRSLINKPLTVRQNERLFMDRFRYLRKHFDALESKGKREVTEQDRALYAMCRPERLLDLTFRYILFGAGEKKIARYQQYFCVKKIMDRITAIDKSIGKRSGGLVWHTQGSGKSLAMVMLAKSIALEPTIESCKIIMVTECIDQYDQIYRAFHHCGKEIEQARTGRHLLELIKGHGKQIIITLTDKFEAAMGVRNMRETDSDIFVLVDEVGGEYSRFPVRMKRVFPNACYIGFTGIPVMKMHKNTIAAFGRLIDSYTIEQAVKDRAVVPLLYENRGYTGQENVMRIAWDISEHFRDNWQGTPFKAQLITQDKAAALLYKRYLDEFGMVVSEVLISAPDICEGKGDIYKENREKVIHFWKVMMDKYGTEKEYNRQIINAFKYGEAPEIIIVVDKLITDFDAPCNTVIYLTRRLKGQTLLQAIARINRLYKGKEFGYVIDYCGLSETPEHVFDIYGQLSEFNRDDLFNIIEDISVPTQTLPQKHSDLWDIFKSVKNKGDEDACGRRLTDKPLRIEFYKRFSRYARTMAVAVSSLKFLKETPEEKIAVYRRDLIFFKEIRRTVQRKYAEGIDFSDEYEPKIQKLIDTQLGTGEVEYAASDAIMAFKEEGISSADYLKETKEIINTVVNQTGDNIPESLRDRDIAKAYFSCILKVFESHKDEGFDIAIAAAEAGIAIDDIIMQNRIVNWIANIDIQNQMRNEIEDYIFELKKRYGFLLSFDEIDTIMDQCLDIARKRLP
ncbi:MAG: type I restriction endonuclease subunit R [Nitrospirota bacterium]